MNTKERSSIFDSVKGIAMIAIFMVHMGSWNSIVSFDSYWMRIISRGSLGVELTYIVNAFFYTKSYNSRIRSGKTSVFSFLAKMILRLMPVYYLAMIVNAISLYLANGSISESPANIISHFLFLNVLNPYWWNSFMGGSGYITVLVFMWLIYPFYLKIVDSLKKSVMGAFAVCTVSYAIYMLLLLIVDKYVAINDVGFFYEWLWYINRGFYTFSLGTVLYYINEANLLQVTKKYKWILTLSGIAMVVMGIIHNNSFDGLVFAMISLFIITINLKEPICLVDNPVFAFLGQYSMEIFASHIVLYYVIVQNQKILAPGRKTFFVIAVLTIIVSVILKQIVQKPFNAITDAIFKARMEKREIKISV